MFFFIFYCWESKFQIFYINPGLAPAPAQAPAPVKVRSYPARPWPRYFENSQTRPQPWPGILKKRDPAPTPAPVVWKLWPRARPQWFCRPRSGPTCVQSFGQFFPRFSWAVPPLLLSFLRSCRFMSFNSCCIFLLSISACGFFDVTILLEFCEHT